MLDGHKFKSMQMKLHQSIMNVFQIPGNKSLPCADHGLKFILKTCAIIQALK